MTSPNLNSAASQTSSFVVGPGANAPAAVTQNAGVQNPAAQDRTESPFVDRRTNTRKDDSGERRQFGSSHSGLSDAGRELALAIDQYKLENHRRYITCDEMLNVLLSLGYSREA